MKEITIVSGKGGTGKTSITAALATIAQRATIADCDVDAADLHLLLNPQIINAYSFSSGAKAIISNTKCTNCGLCHQLCRFDAIHYKPQGGLWVNPFQCEGCRLCERACPSQAISIVDDNDNQWFESETAIGPMIHARMEPGGENSGKLVTTIRSYAKQIAQEKGYSTIINDGPPGIGCPVIASITGASDLLFVIEPTKSGLHDAKRIIELSRKFSLRRFAIINKADMNLEVRQDIVDMLATENIPLLAEIPYTNDFVEAMVRGLSIVQHNPKSEISKMLTEVWKHILNN